MREIRVTDASVFCRITRKSARQPASVALHMVELARKSAGQIYFRVLGSSPSCTPRALRRTPRSSTPGLIVDCRLAGSSSDPRQLTPKTVSDLSSTIGLRRASGRHTDQTEAQAEVLTCTQPVQIGHTWRPDTHSPTKNQSYRDTTRGPVPSLPHNQHASAPSGRCSPPHTTTAGPHSKNRTTPSVPLPLRSAEWSRKSSYKSPQNTMPGPDPSTHAPLYGVGRAPSKW